MYPSIDNEVCLAACKEVLDRREELSPSTECLLEAIKITLECNNSTFNKKYYRQNRGRAMGPRSAYSYANLTMTTTDKKFLMLTTGQMMSCSHQTDQDSVTTASVFGLKVEKLY